MSEDLQWGDEERYKKKTKICGSIVFFLVIVLGGLQIFRSDKELSLVQKYGDLIAKQQWVEAFNAKRQIVALNNARKAVPLRKLEEVRQAKAEQFVKHNIRVKSVSNTPVKAGSKSPVHFAESRAELEGNWENICAGLETFNQGDDTKMEITQHDKSLAAISRIEIRNNTGSNGVSANVTYRIYYK